MTGIAPPTSGSLPGWDDTVSWDFYVQGVITGGCDEHYTLGFSFSDADTWSGVFHRYYYGSDCALTDCSEGSESISGSRQ
ncbi:MAG TPA: hypothetical protein DIU15_01740 [Deltaproteobacteria bacterium]|nr:hypothetical protein [Deltaproteobacteria bacterium]